MSLSFPQVDFRGRRLFGCNRVPGIVAALLVALASGESPAEDVRAADPRLTGQSASELTAWLDQQFDQIWSASGVEVAPVHDVTFLRRIYVDLVGRIPSVAEVQDFQADEVPYKRERLVDRLLVDNQDAQRNSREFAEHFARVWRRMMLPAGGNAAALGRQFESWLAGEFRENVPYDKLARALLTARGDDSGGTAPYYEAVGGNPEGYAAAFTRVFLGVRIGCAQCHNHPFASWQQRDFWGMAAFFAGTSGSQDMRPGLTQLEESEIATISYEGVEYPAKALWGEPREIAGGRLPREVLAEWMTAQENAQFAETAVNRVWQHLCGRGLVAAVDDLDQAPPEERDPVLAELGPRFTACGYDLRGLVAAVCKSRAYQCPSASADEAAATLAAGRRPLKTMTSEQVFDSLEQALMLPVTRSNTESPRHNGTRMQMIARLDESVSDSPEDYSAGIPQVLLMMNGLLMAEGTSLERSRTLRGVVEAPFLSTDDKLDTLFLAALTRVPTDRERLTLAQHIADQATEEDRGRAYADLFWALLNSPEFVLCR